MGYRGRYKAALSPVFYRSPENRQNRYDGLAPQNESRIEIGAAGESLRRPSIFFLSVHGGSRSCIFFALSINSAMRSIVCSNGFISSPTLLTTRAVSKAKE